MSQAVLQSKKIVSETLKKVLRDRSRKNPSYSMRAFARDLHLSPGFISALLEGKKNLSLSTAQKILQVLNVPLRKQKKFLKAVTEASIQMPNHEVARILEEPGYTLEYEQYDIDRFQFFNQWYHVAISDLTTCADFKYDIDWICQKLNLEADVVRSSIGRLIRLGVLQEIKGTLTKTNRWVAVPTNSSQAIIRNFHTQMIQKALDNLALSASEDYLQRDISGLTFAVAPSKIEEAKKKIANFKRDMADLSEEEPSTELYQLNIQLFPLTRKKTQESR